MRCPPQISCLQMQPSEECSRGLLEARKYTRLILDTNSRGIYRVVTVEVPEVGKKENCRQRKRNK